MVCGNYSNAGFSQMIESVQYNATLAITGAIHGFSCEKINQGFGFERLHDERLYRKLCCYKMQNKNRPNYLSKLLPIVG